MEFVRLVRSRQKLPDASGNFWRERITIRFCNAYQHCGNDEDSNYVHYMDFPNGTWHMCVNITGNTINGVLGDIAYYDSQFFVIDTQTLTLYSASSANLTSWSQVISLPEASCYGSKMKVVSYSIFILPGMSPIDKDHFPDDK